MPNWAKVDGSTMDREVLGFAAVDDFSAAKRDRKDVTYTDTLTERQYMALVSYRLATRRRRVWQWARVGSASVSSCFFRLLFPLLTTAVQLLC